MVLFGFDPVSSLEKLMKEKPIRTKANLAGGGADLKSVLRPRAGLGREQRDLPLLQLSAAKLYGVAYLCEAGAGVPLWPQGVYPCMASIYVDTAAGVLQYLRWKISHQAPWHDTQPIQNPMTWVRW